MTRLVILTAAEADIRAAREWYNETSPGLGDGFLLHLEDAIDLIINHPELYQIVFDDMRRKPLHRFPYNVLYRVLPDAVQVIGVLHGLSDPEQSHSRRQALL